jgi:hypothetical protein
VDLVDLLTFLDLEGEWLIDPRSVLFLAQFWPF